MHFYSRSCSSEHKRIFTLYNSIKQILFLLFIRASSTQALSASGHIQYTRKHSGVNVQETYVSPFDLKRPLRPDELEYTQTEQLDAKTRLYGTNYGSGFLKKTVPVDSHSLYHPMIATYRAQSPKESDHIAIPKFIQQPPSILYAFQGQPAIVHCVAQPVIILYTVCSNNLSGDGNRRNKISSVSLGSPSMKHGLQRRGDLRGEKLAHDVQHVARSRNLRLEVTRYITAQTVEDWFGDFWCYCEAWNNVVDFGEPRVVITPRTHIQLAYLNKRFVRQPTSARILIGWRAEFICDAPEGRPTPQIYWYKNSELLNATTLNSRISIVHDKDMSHLSATTVTTDNIDEPTTEVRRSMIPTKISGSRLTIHSTRLVDEGQYICIAENIAGRRISSPAQLTIHADGRWSEWSDWSSCPAECSGWIREKYSRQPNNMSRSTTASICPAHCHNHSMQRQRHCNAPKPNGGGRPCPGLGLEEASCFDYCQSIQSNSSYGNRKSPMLNSSPTNGEICLLSVLAFAILVFLTATCFVIYFFLRKYCSAIIEAKHKKPMDLNRSAIAIAGLDLVELGIRIPTSSRPHGRQTISFVSNSSSKALPLSVSECKDIYSSNHQSMGSIPEFPIQRLNSNSEKSFTQAMSITAEPNSYTKCFSSDSPSAAVGLIRNAPFQPNHPSPSSVFLISPSTVERSSDCYSDLPPSGSLFLPSLLPIKESRTIPHQLKALDHGIDNACNLPFSVEANYTHHAPVIMGCRQRPVSMLMDMTHRRTFD